MDASPSLDDLLSLSDGERGAFVRYARQEAHEQAQYAKMDLRHTMLERPIEVESRIDRERREIAEQEAKHAERRRRERAERDREVREARRHELSLVRAQAEANNGNGIDWGSLLSAIGDALGGLADRVEALESRLDELQGNDKRYRAPRRKATRKTTTPLPGRWPWKSPDGTLRYTQPIVTVR
jgi:hypothetical protein